MSNNFHQQLGIALENATRVNILSPYLTMPAVNFLFEHLPLGVDTKIIVRARPADIISGAVDINALSILHQSGVKCFLHRTLHGKFYQINESEGFIGSANFTSNGLCLTGYGNLELTVKVSLSSNDRLLIASVFQDAIPITSSMIKKIIEFSSKQEKNLECCPAWWENILPIMDYIPSNDGLYVGDLPWCNLFSDNKDADIEHDEDIFLYGKSLEEMKFEFLQSKIYLFIVDAISHRGNKQMYFGELSECIHGCLKDDLLPYRKEVKGYIINLLSYLEKLVPEQFSIDRPNYSQRITLIY
ncbi:MAG: phospholipase D-like domain-containing protein [Silvania sp.]|uniref:phospholipase D-like domain-containing protein n=1 Tax=Silvania sp. TaxID=3016633 RepID=UPI003EE43A6C